MPSVLFLCNFFGCGTGYSTTEIARLKQQGHIIVYDHTHTAFNTDDPILPLADYYFAALRKWLPIASGAILHMPHNTSAPALKPYPHTQLQWQAMQLKQNYLNGQINDKDAFFAYFHQFAEHLLTDYQHYGPDEQSLNYIIHANIKGILKQRKRNATMLREAFKNAPIDIPQSQTDHLFVPVFLPHEVRNSLRKHLTDNNIYCPIHWPQPQQTKPFPEASKIYESELSIICDQRYDTHAMNRIIQTINNFL